MNVPRVATNAFTDAWLSQTGPTQRNGMVLHNAVMFFAIRGPEFATTLLRRSIAMEPNETLYVERLGEVYGLTLGQRKDGTPPSGVFTRQARATLLHSDDCILVRGAALALERCNCDLDHLYQELSAKGDALSAQGVLPSWSERFRTKPCKIP
jgi:hypothetical protein